jgi:hypothetical protein
MPGSNGRGVLHRLRLESCASRAATKKKSDVAERPEEFDHVGLLVNEPPGMAGLPFI